MVTRRQTRITDSRCDHCGVAVPIVTLPAEELAAFRATIPEMAIA